MNIAEYLSTVQSLYASGQTTEHSFRPALAKLFDSIAADVKAINEPKAVRVGRPDFVMMRGQITVGHCEAKDIGLDINPKAMKDFNKAQYERYVKALPNLIYTNGLDFRFYKNGELAREISIADYLMGIQPKPDQFDVLANQLKDFAAEKLQTITSAERLAEMMAGKAVLIKDILFNTLKEDADLASELAGQFKAFKTQLIHDLGIEEFSDIYAETVAYGMFAARLHDETLKDFSREEALQLLPKSNPFLRNLFSYVAGPNLDEGIRRTIDELAEIFQATNLPKLFADFGKFTQRNDPFIHFYETFLAEYNPAKRKARGVWYTPEPVVNFIVRAVDDVLKTEFGLADGLADTSKITIDWDTGFEKAGNPIIEKRELHRVQILDPAAGTGTFLAEVIKQIAPKVKDVAPGKWSSYVEKELIPRLHGFELLMASYAMCHMKLDMMLKDMKYKPTANPPRLNVYLTNSLEEGDSEPKDLFMAKWLSNEANLANDVKRKTPIMCVIGNPPYSGESANKGDWIMGLMEAYKKEPGGKQKLQERNPKWINDDYVKFIRFAEHMIAKNGEGVLGFITNHGYLDNPTFRGMRWHLLNTFDKIWVLDLHGNSNKKEVSPDGSPDKNVFDIMAGVAIVIGVKKRLAAKAEKPLALLHHGELWGDRKGKYDALWKSEVVLISNATLPIREPQYTFVSRDFSLQSGYLGGFGIQELLTQNSVGIVTARDSLTIDMDRDELWKRVEDFTLLDAETLRRKYHLGKDVQDWSVSRAKADVTKHGSQANLTKIAYRPFDSRWTFFTGTSRGFQCRPRAEVMQNFIRHENIGLSVCRQSGVNEWAHISCTNMIVDDSYVSNRSKERGYSYPLYLYPSESELDQTRRVNMDPKIRKAIENAAEDEAHGRPDEVAIFDYIYGVLHCPAYRETYREFLKIDFPRVPYPPSPDVFWDVSAKGAELRRLHLMEDAAIGAAPFKFDGEGDSIVGKVEFKPVGEIGRVCINDTQYFDDVPQIAWSFYIGGYQPAQKWLKDRKGRELKWEDIRHYQKIIKILSETDRIMKTIEMPL
jgi:type I restriction-modification system DNA methylase subunit